MRIPRPEMLNHPDFCSNPGCNICFTDATNRDIEAEKGDPRDITTWRTAGGRVLKITEMTDGHVMNAVNWLRRNGGSPRSYMLPVLERELQRRMDAAMGTEPELTIEQKLLEYVQRANAVEAARQERVERFLAEARRRAAGEPAPREYIGEWVPDGNVSVTLTPVSDPSEEGVTITRKGIPVDDVMPAARGIPVDDILPTIRENLVQHEQKVQRG